MCFTCAPSRRRVLLGAAATALSLPMASCVDSGGSGIVLVSEQQVQDAGLRSWTQIAAQTPPSRNAVHIDSATDVTTRLVVAAGERPAFWEVRVFAGSQINAFALPGRKIGVYDGLFRVADTPDRLATVIGHEIGHVQARHASERVNTEAAAGLGLDLLGIALAAGNVGGAQEIGAALGLGVEYGLIRPYSRQQELEADAFGLRLMDRAGYDPREAIVLWQRMQQAGTAAPELLSTHPAPATRIEEMQGLVEALA